MKYLETLNDAGPHDVGFRARSPSGLREETMFCDFWDGAPGASGQRRVLQNEMFQNASL